MIIDFKNNNVMKTLIMSIFVCFILVSCGEGTQRKSEKQTNDSVVYVYYFHGKQRCKTCIAVEEVARQTVTDNFNMNSKVKYIEIRTDKKENEKLIEKYEITWNALIVAKGDNYIDITNDAFSVAVNSPEVLAEQIKTEVNKFLE
jgi:hypothetical protein